MAEQGMTRLSAWLLNCLILTQSQIQAFIDVKALLNTVVDCLRFVTEFFEVISQSLPHIYHSALQLTPQSSIVWKLYSHQIYSPRVRVVTGVPPSWDSCTASTANAGLLCHPVWSPCGQFIAADCWRAIQFQDSKTLRGVSVLKPSSSSISPKYLTFSPDGCLLACSCFQ